MTCGCSSPEKPDDRTGNGNASARAEEGVRLIEERVEKMEKALNEFMVKDRAGLSCHNIHERPHLRT